MLIYDPARRLSAKAALTSPYFVGSRRQSASGRPAGNTAGSRQSMMEIRNVAWCDEGVVVRRRRWSFVVYFIHRTFIIYQDETEEESARCVRSMFIQRCHCW